MYEIGWRINVDELPISIYGQSHGVFDEVEIFHDSLKFHPATLPMQQQRIARFLKHGDVRARMAHSAKRYRYAPKIALPEARSLKAPLASLIERRSSVRRFRQGLTDIQSLGDVLAGSLRHLPAEEGVTRLQPRRPYASGGALYPVEAYVIPLNVEGLRTGIGHYEPREHSLRYIQDISIDELLPALLGDTAFIKSASFMVFLTAVFWRSCEKYGNRGYLFTLLEAGQILQTFALSSLAAGFVGTAWGGYIDDTFHGYLDVNGVDESIVACMIFGMPDVG